MRLNQLPPAGAWYSAWNANPVPQNALTTTLHHPLGDLKKWAQGHFSQAIFNADSTVHA